MQKIETIERLDEGLAKAASRARELGHSQQNVSWFSIASSLDEMRILGLTLAQAASRSKADVENDIKGYEVQ